MASLVYADIEQANSLKLRVKASEAARLALSSADARSVLSLALGPPTSAAIPSDTPDLTLSPATDTPEWPAILGFPPALAQAIRDAIVVYLTEQIAADLNALSALNADVTGAP